MVEAGGADVECGGRCGDGRHGGRRQVSGVRQSRPGVRTPIGRHRRQRRGRRGDVLLVRMMRMVGRQERRRRR